VDSDKTLKFYDFVDKNMKEKEEIEKKAEEAINELLRSIFAKYDLD
jgi:uncharacterized membrane protein